MSAWMRDKIQVTPELAQTIADFGNTTVLKGKAPVKTPMEKAIKKTTEALILAQQEGAWEERNRLIPLFNDLAAALTKCRRHMKGRTRDKAAITLLLKNCREVLNGND